MTPDPCSLCGRTGHHPLNCPWPKAIDQKGISDRTARALERALDEPILSIKRYFPCCGVTHTEQYLPRGDGRIQRAIANMDAWAAHHKLTCRGALKDEHDPT